MPTRQKKAVRAKADTSKNAAMNRARNARKDEFYTQLSDIEKETRHYRDHFRGKTVLCNCDDPYASQFFVHFFRKFSAYGLKKLVSVCYRNCEPDLFSQNASDHSIMLEYSGGADESRDPTKDEIAKWVRPLKGDGDFRSEECVEILKAADIVVTNPPFSLFREFIAMLVKHDKKFLVIGQHNAIHYAEIFPLFKQGRIWLGNHYGDMEFRVPSYYEPRATRYREDERGNKWRSLGNACWFTNLDFESRHEELTLWREYSQDDFPKYDNYDAIEVGHVSDIPCDYDGVMGVPITIMGKLCPEQFEILGTSTSDMPKGAPYLQGKRIYERILIRRKRMK